MRWGTDLFVHVEFHAIDDGASEGQFVGVFQVVADGDAFGDGADGEVFPVFQFFEDVVAGGVAFDGGAEGEYHFADVPLFDAVHEGLDVEVGGSDAVHGGDDAAEDVVEPVVLGGGFDGEDVLDVFDHADGGGVAFGVGAYLAEVAVGDVVAGAAFPDVAFQVGDALEEGVHVGGVLFEQVEDEFERRLAPYAGKGSKLFHGFVQEFGGVHGVIL